MVATAEPDEPLKQLSFDGNGYIKLNHKLISHKVEDDWKIRMTISTWQPNGLLLWQGKEDAPSFNLFDPEPENYMAMGIKNGHFTFRSNGKDVMVEKTFIIDGNPHNITIEKKKSDIIINVDKDHTASEQFDNLLDQGLMEVLQEEDFYLGGWNGNVDELTEGYFTSGFAGCIHFLDAHNIKTGVTYGSSPEEFKKGLANQDYKGVVSSNKCLLPSKPTVKPPYMTTTTARTTPTTTKSTKRPYVKRDLAFDGKSHATFSKDTLPWEMISKADSVIDINIKLTTQSNSGLLFLQGTRQPSFLSIGGT